ncbi:amino acid adenylation domain-containing protein [Microbacterium lacticum]|uniref:Amino acid adenylation domain-containing protein n=2 Tax=Microbacterium lacticum TaxID=33885 RepID=A0A4Y3UP88_9MICO|nr:amino acid adenylation domain-containing protein [Microbacterium lacticum]TQM90230.1 amino acid adenylation domain-containing protein [Microbacterium lacticum]GEB95170.1 hypothetical protein MLA01_13890 [Microbacterium lacticum]GGN21970.1 hypothetical protein GCM10009724_15280 [Microbacterium lacticum]
MLDDVLHRILGHCSAHPEEPAVTTESATMSYGELDRRSSGIAAFLRGQGISADSIVAVQLARTPLLIATLVGILRAGAAWTTLMTNLPAARRDRILAETGCSIVFVDHPEQVSLPGAVRAVSPAQVPDAVPPAAGAATVSRDSLAYCLFTSGSSGTPKGVVVTRGALDRLVDSVDILFGTALHGRIACTTAQSFDVFNFELFGALANGGELVLLESLLDLSGLPADLRPEIISGVPSALGEIAALGDLPSSVRIVVSAGEPLFRAAAESLTASGLQVWNAYGPTECTVFAMCDLVEDLDDITIGVPLEHVGALVLDEDLREVPAGAVGQLHLTGPQLAREYLHRPAQTAERFLPFPAGEPGDRMYATGDLVVRGEDGRLRYRGRADNQVKVRGYRIELEEVESVLGSHPAVSACIAHVDRRRDDARLAAAITLTGEVAVADVVAHARRHLPRYMVPDTVQVVSSLPRNGSGKIDRRAFASLVAPGRSDPPLQTLTIDSQTTRRSDERDNNEDDRNGP